LIRGFGHYANNRGDELITAMLGATATLGAYNLARQTAELPGGNLIAPLERALFPGFAKLQGEPDRFRAAFVNVYSVVTAIALPATIGLSLVAEEAVAVLFGERWIATATFLPILALSATMVALRRSYMLCLVAMGKVRLAATIVWIEVLVFVAAAIPLGWMLSVLGVALAKLSTQGVMAVLVWRYVSIELGIRHGDIVRAAFRPVMASCGMTVCVLIAKQFDALVAIQLVFQMIVGIISYVTVSGILWVWQGRPEGVEALVLREGRSGFTSFRARIVGR